ncbi:hypothetical protein [Patulibacter defluvii]|uniref:hypothetical protein n=1 Tax=Patulibacter defluvii TaxID=3095358 RepID=UPI002A751326|nr:hypothetical protein [Patulibacter sp. DM4]
MRSPALLALATAVAATALAGCGGDDGGATTHVETGGPSPGAPQTTVAVERLPALVYASNREGPYRLFASDPAGGQPLRVTNEQATFPAWTPDGRRLTFVTEQRGAAPGASHGHDDEGEQDPHEHGLAEGDQVTIAAVALAGPQRAVATFPTGSRIPSHPTLRRVDGHDQIAYQAAALGSGESPSINGPSDIDVLAPTESARRTLVTAGGAAYQPAWSPDGRRLAVALGTPRCRSRRCDQTLVLRRPDGGRDRTLVADGVAGAPAWSPDGRTIAFTWDRGDGPALWTVAVAGGRPRAVPGGGPSASEPTWSPDGRRLAFSRGCDIHVVAVAGGRSRNLTRSPGVCEISPTWRPAG